MTHSELKEFLDEKVELYNKPKFIESDPIQIPHLYSAKEDIEIAGFLASTIAWGNRKMIINNAKKMMDFMGNSPYDFVMSHSDSDLERLENFVHRTFNGKDFTGWRGYGKDAVPAKWVIEDGAIKFNGTGGGEAQEADGGDLIFAHKFKNFELLLDWKVSKGGNSGIFYLAQEV